MLFPFIDLNRFFKSLITIKKIFMLICQCFLCMKFNGPLSITYLPNIFPCLTFVFGLIYFFHTQILNLVMPNLTIFPLVSSSVYLLRNASPTANLSNGIIAYVSV